MSSDSSIRKSRNEDLGADSSDVSMSQNKIKKKGKGQHKTRTAKRYRERNNKKSGAISKHQAITVEEEEKIKRRKEYDKQKSQRYRDRKRAIRLKNLRAAQSSKTVVHVSKCQNCHSSQIAGPSTRNLPYVLPIHTADLTTQNEPYKSESHSDNDDDIQNNTPSQVNYVPQLHEPIITIYEPNTQNILTCDVQNNAQLKKSSDSSKRKRQGDDEGVDFFDNGTSQDEIKDIKKKRNIQNKITCQRYRAKKKTDEMVSLEISNHQTLTAEEEKIKRRKEYDKQKSQRYRDRKRATKLINLLTDPSTKTVVTHVSKCHNCHNSQIAGPSTRNVPYVPPIHTADLSTENEPNISESDSDDDIHRDTPSHVNYVPQLHEPIITIYVPNTPNIIPHDFQNTKLKSSDSGKRKRQDNDEEADCSDDSMS